VEPRTSTVGRRAGRGAGLVLAALLALVAPTACGGGDDEPGTDASKAADGGSSAAPEVDPTEAASDDQAPASVGEFCAPYVEMVRTLDGIDYKQPNADIALEMSAVMRTWAEQMPDLEQPPGLPDDVRSGLLLLAERIEALPDEPTYAELTAVETGLPRQKQELISTASRWFKDNCRFDAE
jgi:hypothetical protein